ncbi:MAG: hypothetical protein SFV22_01660 [Saprospiraceae bacterium]|nr:hypothetical protein [Saprospiraceae bacterium]
MHQFTRLLPFTALLFLLLTQPACKKEDNSAAVTIDIDIKDPVFSVLPDGSIQADMTIVITQLGNYFFEDFTCRWWRYPDGAVLGTYQTILPTAREFVRFPLIVPEPGTYWLETSLGTPQNGSSGRRQITIP